MTDRMSSRCAGNLSDADFCAFPGSSNHHLAVSEQRSSTRYSLEEPVIVETDKGELVGAIVINYGQCGLYFESNFKAPKGAVLKIRNESAFSMPCQGGCEAQVRWTQKIGRANSEYSYGTGVQYC